MNTNKDPFVYRVFVFLLLSCLLVHLIYCGSTALC